MSQDLGLEGATGEMKIGGDIGSVTGWTAVTGTMTEDGIVASDITDGA